MALSSQQLQHFRKDDESTTRSLPAVEQGTEVPKEVNLHQPYTGPRPIIQLRREVVLPEASPLPLVPYTQQNRRRPRSESVERQAPTPRSRSSESPVVTHEKIRVVEPSSTTEMLQEQYAMILQLKEELQKNQNHLQQYQAQFVAMKAEAEQEKTRSELALRKAEERTIQAERRTERVLAHIRQQEEAQRQNENIDSVPLTEAANTDGDKDMHEEPVYPTHHQPIPKPIEHDDDKNDDDKDDDDKDDDNDGDEDMYEGPVYPTRHQPIPKPIEHDDDKDDDSDGDEDMYEEPAYPTHHQPIPKPRKFQRPYGGQGPVLGASLPRNMAPPAEPTYLFILEQLQKTHEMVQRVTDTHNKRQPCTRRPREFKKRIVRNRSVDRNESLTWLRTCMNQLMGIKHDKDILEDEDIFEPKTRIKRKMKAYEKNQEAEGPTLDPMSPNWDDIEGKWNERLFQLFVDYCRMNGYEERVETEDLEHQVQELFLNRITRLRDLIRKSRGMGDEDRASVKKRLDMKTQKTLQRQRRHTRRSQLYNSRLDIALGHIPEDRSMVTEEEAVWINYHTLLDVLGPEGMSSDESDVDDAGHRTYLVKRMDWRDKNVMKKMVDVDKDRNITNGYGNMRAGNPARFRKRRTDGRATSRNAPPDLPINLYDARWYASLRPGQRRELAAGPEVALL